VLFLQNFITPSYLKKSQQNKQPVSWLVVGADLFSEKSTIDWLLVVGLFGEKNTAGWWLIRQTNKAKI
jgi:hypothetical protein